MKLVSGFVSWITSVLLFCGFAVVNLLSGDDGPKYLGRDTADFLRNQKLLLYIVVVGLFALQQVWLRWPSPASHSEVENLKPVILHILIAVYAKYYIVLNPPAGLGPAIRVNIMLPTWRWHRLRQYLKIYYSYGGPGEVMYSNDELDLEWESGGGTCGYAWSKKRLTVYDSNTPGLKSPENGLTNMQKQIVGDIKSVLSVPIWSPRHEKVIGILNLDSTVNIDKTGFNRDNMVTSQSQLARLFSEILFVDGVKPS